MRLGAGGMGEVYRARDPRLNREVAIKVLTETPPRTATACAALNHPNILTVHEIGETEAGPYIVTELLSCRKGFPVSRKNSPRSSGRRFLRSRRTATRPRGSSPRNCGAHGRSWILLFPRRNSRQLRDAVPLSLSFSAWGRWGFSRPYCSFAGTAGKGRPLLFRRGASRSLSFRSGTTPEIPSLSRRTWGRS